MISSLISPTRFAVRFNLDKYVKVIRASGLFDLEWYRKCSGFVGDDESAAIRHYLLAKGRAKVDANRLFDREWYLKKYPDVRISGFDPLIHYILHGASELRNPHPLFDAEYYIESIQKCKQIENPLYYFLYVDNNKLRSPHPLFDGELYARLYSDVATQYDVPFFHYLEFGGAELRVAHILFDSEYYRAHTQEPLKPGTNALVAYLRGPKNAHTHYFFDPDYYLATNEDVAIAGINPLLHYLKTGARESRSPHPLFDQAWYVKRHPTARLLNQTPLASFLLNGIEKGHEPNQYFDSKWYASNYAGLIEENMPPIQHFVRFGLALNLQPSRVFDPAYYFTVNPDVAAAGTPAFLHFMRYGRFEARKFRNPSVVIQQGNNRFAVILHLFYLDLLVEFEQILRPLQCMLDIFITVPADNEHLFTPIVSIAFPTAQIFAVPNEGRDIGALFEVLYKIDLSLYTAVCKLHSKKGVTERDVWRFAMLRALLGSKEIIESILDHFTFNDDLWMVGTADLYISARKFMGPNSRTVLKLFGDMFPHAWPDFDWGFFAGSMFWFRPSAISRLKEVLTPESFASEKFLNDGEMAHGVERVLALACAIEKKYVGLVTLDGDACSIQKLNVRQASDGISYEEPAETLARYARNLTFKIPRSAPPPSGSRLTSSQIEPRQRGVNLIGPLLFRNGLGVSVRGYLRLLAEAGINVNCINWVQGFERLSALDVELPIMSEPSDINIVHMNLDLLLAGEFLISGSLYEMMRKARRNILIFYWELPALLPQWIELLHYFDEIWCPTAFIQKMVQSVSNTPARLVRPEVRMRGECLAAADRPHFNLPADRFVFAYFADGGSILRRKNPMALVEAFTKEFREEENACCYLKIHYSGEASVEVANLPHMIGARKDIILCGNLFSEAEMDVLFQSIDCYVSPHRSEGLGLTILEAMQRGKPVIATPFGGSKDFVGEDNAYPLAYDLVEVGPGAEPYPATGMWAEPSIDSLRRQMRWVFQNKQDVDSTVEKAKEKLQQEFDNNRTSLDAIFQPQRSAP